MPWLIAVFLVLGIGALTALFVLNARALHRDVHTRFRKVRLHLEQQAAAVLKPLLEHHESTRPH